MQENNDYKSLLNIDLFILQKAFNNRNFKEDPEIEDGVTNRKVRDLGTEGLIFIPADKSPMDQALVVASNEVSGTTTIYIVVTRGVEP